MLKPGSREASFFKQGNLVFSRLEKVPVYLMLTNPTFKGSKEYATVCIRIYCFGLGRIIDCQWNKNESRHFSKWIDLDGNEYSPGDWDPTG